MSKFKNWAVKKIAATQGIELEEGQGLAEYGLILALIAIVCIGALQLLGTNISARLNQIANAL